MACSHIMDREIEAQGRERAHKMKAGGGCGPISDVLLPFTVRHPNKGRESRLSDELQLSEGKGVGVNLEGRGCCLDLNCDFSLMCPGIKAKRLLEGV